MHEVLLFATGRYLELLGKDVGGRVVMEHSGANFK